MWKSPVIEVIDLSDFEGVAIAFFYLLSSHFYCNATQQILLDV